MISIMDNTNSINNSNLNSKSDSEEFESLENIPDQNKEAVDVFQIQPENKNFKIIKVGRMECSGNVLIKQLTYKQNIVRIVNCLYDNDEIKHYTKEDIIPIVEIYVFSDKSNYIVFSYCVIPSQKNYVITKSENKKYKVIDTYNLPINKDKVVEVLITKMKQDLS